MHTHSGETAGLQTTVLIAGGGPVGMGLAIELGQRGVPVLVVERHLQPQPIPKGQNLTQRTLEHFHVWGAERQLRAARTIPPEYGIGGLTAYGTLLGPHYHDWLQRDLVRDYYFTANERLPQYATEAVLRARAAELSSVKILYGWEVLGLQRHGEGAEVTIAERGGHERRRVSARFVVGCDGARSRVREQAGITQTLTSHDRLMVLLVFRSTGLHALLERYPGKSYYNVLQPALQGYWKFFGRVDLGHTWFFHAPVPAGTTADNFDFRALLQEAVGAEFDVEFQHVGFWDLRFALADTYRSGACFVAGDAAHSHPPYGGYGVNAGLEDARNLGWKLAAVVEGWAGDDLLGSYDAERRPVFRSTIDDFIVRAIDNDRLFLDTFDPARDPVGFAQALQQRARGAVGEVQSYEPHYTGSPVVVHAGPAPGPTSALGSHRFEARAGHHLAPARLADGRQLFEVLGHGFSLLAFGAADADVDAFAAAAAALRMPLTVIRSARGGEADRYQATLVLVRPDHFVAWCSSDARPDARQAGQVLRRVLALTPVPSPSA